MTITERYYAKWNKAQQDILDGDLARAWKSELTVRCECITTPTLILHDTGDPRVPITNSYEMYHVLKDNGVIVKFIAFPIPGHEPGDPVHDSDKDRVWLEWLDQYLK